MLLETYDKFEYKTLTGWYNYNNLVVLLNEEGKNGWEVVSIDEYDCLLKRKVSVYKEKKQISN